MTLSKLGLELARHDIDFFCKLSKNFNSNVGLTSMKSLGCEDYRSCQTFPLRFMMITNVKTLICFITIQVRTECMKMDLKHGIFKNRSYLPK